MDKGSNAKPVADAKSRPITASDALTTKSASSPYTPVGRAVSTSLYNSPNSRFRIDDENLLIFEIGARSLKAGFAGESGPRCNVSYGPEQLRRLGDYRYCMSDFAEQSQRHHTHDDDWDIHDYELWRPDLQDADLNFVGERIERLVRDIESTYLLLDTRPRKISLVVSSYLPRILLELTLSALFNVLQGPSITILASNVMSVISSGLRSALVVDIGWAETTISAVLELREVACHRTVRAAKMLTKACSTIASSQDTTLSLPAAEDLVARLAWCRIGNEVGRNEQNAKRSTEEEVTIEDNGHAFRVSWHALSQLVEDTFFTSTSSLESHDFDDHDLPLHLLAYQALLQLPMDVRKVCMSRIVVVGGASNIPGLKTRLVSELEQLISRRGWNPIKTYGTAANTSKPQHKSNAPLRQSSASTVNTRKTTKLTETTNEEPQDTEAAAKVPAHALPQERDDIMEKIQARASSNNNNNNGSNATTNHNTGDVPGVLRCVRSLGSWAGASLMVGLRLRGAVEVERDKFMSSGLVGSLAKAHAGNSAVTAGPRGGPAAVPPEKFGPTLPSWL